MPTNLPTPLPLVRRVSRLDGDQIEFLAECYTEFCGVDVEFDDYENEMKGARSFVKDIMKIWDSKRKKPERKIVSPPPPRPRK